MTPHTVVVSDQRTDCKKHLLCNEIELPLFLAIEDPISAPDWPASPCRQPIPFRILLPAQPTSAHVLPAELQSDFRAYQVDACRA